MLYSEYGLSVRVSEGCQSLSLSRRAPGQKALLSGRPWYLYLKPGRDLMCLEGEIMS